MSQQVFALDNDDGKLSFGKQYFWGAADIILEENLIGIVEQTKKVHFEDGAREMPVLKQGNVYWVREGDLK